MGPGGGVRHGVGTVASSASCPSEDGGGGGMDALPSDSTLTHSVDRHQ